MIFNTSSTKFNDKLKLQYYQSSLSLIVSVMIPSKG